MSLQIRDFMIGAVHSYQLMKVVLGLSACAWGVATEAEPDLGVLRSFWMKTLFAVAAFALGAYYSWHDDANTSRIRRWMPLTCTALQVAAADGARARVSVP